VAGAGDEADIYLVNTCTVTGKAEQKARRLIRHALDTSPGAVVIVTGCYAQMDPQGVSSLGSRVFVVSGDDKAILLNLAAWLHENWQGHGDLYDAVREWKDGVSKGEDRFAFHPGSFGLHSRPSLKVQDGCDNRCAYCRVCIARGPSISLDPLIALQRAQRLEDSGKAEIVLTGINLSQYRFGETDFPGLLTLLTNNTSSIRFRISSYEPEKVSFAFLEAFSPPRIQPHVHLAAQSGSTSVLNRMARPYKAEKILQAVEALRAAKDDPFIAADIIAGFPGESEAEFAETLALCKELDFAWIHAFPFSARPGTRAYDLKPKVPERVSGERVEALGALARDSKARYIKRWIGRTVSVIFEKDGNQDEDSGVYIGGTSENYLKVLIAKDEHIHAAGTAHRVVLTSSLGDSDADVAGKLADS
jgi:threonylcarbamoyladenosine tRNA methylthiotransferase MtaB